jgi:hypothetical protein
MEGWSFKSEVLSEIPKSAALRIGENNDPNANEGDLFALI